MQPEAFAEKERKDSGRPSSDLARMAGARFVRILLVHTHGAHCMKTKQAGRFTTSDLLFSLAGAEGFEPP